MRKFALVAAAILAIGLITAVIINLQKDVVPAPAATATVQVAPTLSTPVPSTGFRVDAIYVGENGHVEVDIIAHGTKTERYSLPEGYRPQYSALPGQCLVYVDALGVLVLNVTDTKGSKC